jgi:hypothetical protein
VGKRRGGMEGTYYHDDDDYRLSCIVVAAMLPTRRGPCIWYEKKKGEEEWYLPLL